MVKADTGDFIHVPLHGQFLGVMWPLMALSIALFTLCTISGWLCTKTMFYVEILDNLSNKPLSLQKKRSECFSGWGRSTQTSPEICYFTPLAADPPSFYACMP